MLHSYLTETMPLLDVPSQPEGNMTALIVLVVLFVGAVVCLWTTAILKWRKKSTQLQQALAQQVEQELQAQQTDETNQEKMA